MMEFVGFPKIARLARPAIITEKIDGTNAQIYISFENHTSPVHVQLTEVGPMSISAGSRNRWLTVDNDNFGFAKWVQENAKELLALGEGRHFGEWWGQGIQRTYGLGEKRFSLFNTGRWFSEFNVNAKEGRAGGSTLAYKVPVCHVVPVLGFANFGDGSMVEVIQDLRDSGSSAAPGFRDPEGIVVHHTASNQMFKKTLHNDDAPKGAGTGDAP